MSAYDDRDAPQTPRTWVVVGEKLAIRAEPSLKGRLVASRAKGDEVSATRAAADGWLEIHGATQKQFALIDATALGYGLLLARKDEPIKLKVINPADGSPFFDLEARTSSTILQCRKRVGEHTLPNGGRLNWQSIVPARGKMGTRIIDAKYNLFEDASTLADCGLDDGDEFAFCYLGTAEVDLKMV